MMLDTDVRILTYTEQKNRGVLYPRGICPVCEVGYRITKNDLMFRHGPPGAQCAGTYERALGLPAKEA